MSVSTLLNRVQVSDEHLEANLCTTLQSLRGTKQYWFIRQSELRCMIREWGSPTLFLTFSCAEYESPNITDYLRTANHKLFDPENENQREDYYYSLILLFTPFREESSLLLEDETAEEAFSRLVNSDCSAYHAKLKRMLEAQSNIKKINEANTLMVQKRAN